MSDKTFDILNKIFVGLIVIIILYPLLFVVSASISDPLAVSTGEMWLWPVDITFDGFKMVFNNSEIWVGYRNTIIYVIVGIIVHLCLLLPSAYGLSRPNIKGKLLLMWYMLFTMLFNGGMIPTYLVVSNLGMLDTLWAIVVPGALGAWSILVTRTFFSQNVPNELVEAAKIDGASDFYIFFKIALPLSIPIIAVMSLFHGVGLWNQYFSALIYLSSRSLYPLQLILREILVLSQVTTSGEGMQELAGTAGSFADQVRMGAQIKYAVMIVSSLPLIVVYPFIQGFFVQGVLIGSVKE